MSRAFVVWLLLVAAALSWPARRSAQQHAADYTIYLGDTNEYRIAKIIADSAGNIYATGQRLLTSGPQPVPNGIFITKLDPLGGIAFTTAIPGSDFRDQANDIAVDSAGNTYVAGVVSSPTFPLRNALQAQRSLYSQTGFILKLDPNGSLIYSSYFGGTLGSSSVNAIAVDAGGNMYVTGTTSSSDFAATPGLPGERPFFGVGGHSPAFIVRISPAGDRIIYAALIGGSQIACDGCCSTCFDTPRMAAGNAIALDGAGNVYIAGNTNVTDLPTTPGALVPQGGLGAFVGKVKADGTAMDYLTYIGITSHPAIVRIPANTVAAMLVDEAGNATIAGSSSDPNFPATPGALQPVCGDPADSSTRPPPDAFVARLNAHGTGMLWATCLGGAAADSATSIGVDPAGNIWLGGTTASPEFPNPNGWITGSDFLVGLNSAGSALFYAARFPDGSASQSLAIDPAGLIHTAGTKGFISVIVPSQPPSPHIHGLTNSAWGGLTGRLAPNEVISIYGPRIGPSTAVSSTLDSSGQAPTSLGGVQVLIDGTPAPLLYVSGNQINAVVPPGVSGKTTAQVRITANDAALPEFSAVVEPAEPQIFRYPPPNSSAVAANEDGSINSPDNRAALGSLLTIWATGTGAADAGDTRCCEVFVNPGSAAEVLHTGPAPGLATGITQITFRLAASYLPNLPTSVFIRVGNKSSAAAEIFVAE